MFCIAVSVAWYADRSRLAEKLQQSQLALHIAKLESGLMPDKPNSERRQTAARLEFLSNAESDAYSNSEVLSRYIPMLICALDDDDYRVTSSAKLSLETIAKRLKLPIEIEFDGWGKADEATIANCWRWHKKLAKGLNGG